MQDVSMAALPYAHTLIETRIYIKQKIKTHTKDAKKIIDYVQFRVLQQTSVTSDIRTHCRSLVHTQQRWSPRG